MLTTPRSITRQCAALTSSISAICCPDCRACRWDDLHETQQQIDARRRENMLFEFRAATYK